MTAVQEANDFLVPAKLELLYLTFNKSSELDPNLYREKVCNASEHPKYRVVAFHCGVWRVAKFTDAEFALRQAQDPELQRLELKIAEATRARNPLLVAGVTATVAGILSCLSAIFYNSSRTGRNDSSLDNT